jgi:cytochrome oxidase Cu insertion factor (SCO1/SenC/PrrC family)
VIAAAMPPGMVMPAPRPRPFVPVLREGDVVPDLPLRDQRGRPFSFDVTDDKITIVSFIYTTCGDPAMCPLIAAKFAYLQRHIDPRSIRLVTVTLDPAHDTPAVLRRYGARYAADAARWSLVTGEPSRVDEIVARFGIVEGHPRPGVIGHTEAAIVLDAHDRIAQIIDGAAWNADDVLAVADALTVRGGSPLRRFGLWLGSRASALCGGRGASPFSVATGLVLLAVFVAAALVVLRRVFRLPVRPG